MTQHITRLLRKSMTSWERKLWNVLRNKQLKNTKFRKQFKIGQFIVDFCCLEYKLVIELDGGHHYTPEQQLADKERQRYIENLGYKVIRFQNIDIDTSLDGVVLNIIKHL